MLISLNGAVNILRGYRGFCWLRYLFANDLSRSVLYVDISHVWIQPFIYGSCSKIVVEEIRWASKIDHPLLIARVDIS